MAGQRESAAWARVTVRVRVRVRLRFGWCLLLLGQLRWRISVAVPVGVVVLGVIPTVGHRVLGALQSSLDLETRVG